MTDRISWTWRHAVLKSGLKPTTRHVLLTLSCYMNDIGGGCYPTTKQLAASTGLSERAVCTHLELAFASGWINRKRHGFAGQRWANHEYEPSFPEDKGTEPSSVRTCEGTEPNDGKALNLVQSKVSDKVPYKNTPIIPLDRFDEFWTAYPKKAGKVAAKKAWAKAVKSHDPESIIQAARIYAISRNGADPAYTKHPQGWLNDGRFMDEQSANAPPKTAGSVLDDIRSKIDQHESRKEFECPQLTQK